jgi:ABC-type multidrug transport system fused ATPase/permease subunit
MNPSPRRLDPFGVLSLWRESRPGRSARFQLVAVLPRVSWPLSLAVLGSIVLYGATALAFVVLTGAAVGTVPAAVRDGFGSPAGQRLLLLLSATGFVIVVQQARGPVHASLVAMLGRRTDTYLRERVMQATLRPCGLRHLEDPAVLDLVRDAGGVGEGQFTPAAAVEGLAAAMTVRLVTLQAAALVASYRWWLAASLLMFSVVVRYRVARDSVHRRGAGGTRTELLRRADYLRDLAVTPAAAKEVRIFDLASWLLGQFRTSWLDGMRRLWRERHQETAGSRLWSLPWGALTAGALYLVGRSGAHGELSLSEMAVLVQAVLTAGLVYVGPFDIQLAYGAAALPAVRELERRTVEEPFEGRRGGRSPAGLPQREIRFERVSFQYPGSATSVLHDLDLVIPAGTSVALVGPNGAGKTTLVKLLAGLYEPSSGQLTVDGTPLVELDRRAWQRRFAAIFQDFVRYELPARTNIAFGDVEHQDDDDSIVGCAAMAGARRLVEALPAGWDTVLSREYADGRELSGGEWQRIALARAFFAMRNGAGVLVLDEPTANLDVRAEAALFDTLLDQASGLTVILISHRFSSVRRADVICVVENGRITERGSHDQLVAASGRYAEMFRLQASKFDDQATVRPAVPGTVR